MKKSKTDLIILHCNRSQMPAHQSAAIKKSLKREKKMTDSWSRSSQNLRAHPAFRWADSLSPRVGLTQSSHCLGSLRSLGSLSLAQWITGVLWARVRSLGQYRCTLTMCSLSLILVVAISMLPNSLVVLATSRLHMPKVVLKYTDTSLMCLTKTSLREATTSSATQS